MARRNGGAARGSGNDIRSVARPAAGGTALAMTHNPNSFMSAAAVAWAIAGWSAVLLVAIVRLSAIALEALASDLTALQWATLAGNTALLAWAEGYRGFQQRFTPRAVARVLYLRQHPTPAIAWLAPLFCVGFFRATPRVLQLTWTGAALIVLLILVVHGLPQPWRGIVDLGVVVGLSWGLVSFLVMGWSALRSGRYPADPEVPVPVPRL